MKLNKQIEWIVFALIIFATIGCSKEEIDLNGHWHLYKPNGTPYNYTTLDINDSIAIIDKNKFNSYNCQINYNDKKDRIEIINDIYFSFYFKIKGDTLLSFDDNGNKVIIGVKPKTEKCTIESDFFATEMVSISLPIMDQQKTIKPPNPNYEVGFFVGKPKSSIQGQYGDKTKLESSTGFIEIDKINLTNAQLEAKIPQTYQDKIYAVFFVDKQTSTNYFQKILDKQKEIIGRDIYIAGKLDEVTNDKSNIVLLKIDSTKSIEPDMSIDDWLKMK